MEELEEKKYIRGFNARIGRKERKYEGEKDKEIWRNSKDRIVNNDVKVLIDILEEKSWEIGNGNMRGDETGEWTYPGGRRTYSSVMDYIIVNQKAWDRMEKLTIRDRVESDHQQGGGITGEVERKKEEWQEKIKEVIQ